MLGSPSRLDLSLVLIEHSLGNMKTVSTTPCLRSLPIRINYAWQNNLTSKDVERIAAALKQRNRVHGIVFEGQTLQLEEVFRKMRCPFPALERLEICCPCPPKLPPTFLRGSAPRLRRLKMSPIHFKSISQLLSSAMALVELSLQIDTVFGPSPTTSLVAYLQNMPCLRWLTLSLPSLILPTSIPAFSENGGTIVPLSKLTFFRFYGHQVFLDDLMFRLAAPSLWTFSTELPGSSISPIWHISRFIADINAEYHGFRVTSLHYGSFTFSLLAQSECIDDPNPHFNFHSQDIMQIGNVLSPRLAIVKELFLISFYKSSPPATLWCWRRFLRLFPNVKVLRLQHKIMFEIAHSLQQDQGESNTTVLRSLEEIELCTWSRSTGSAAEDERRSAMEAFNPSLASLQRAGRSVKIVWSRVHDGTWKCLQDVLSAISEWAYTVWCHPSLRMSGF